MTICCLSVDDLVDTLKKLKLAPGEEVAIVAPTYWAAKHAIDQYARDQGVEAFVRHDCDRLRFHGVFLVRAVHLQDGLPDVSSADVVIVLYPHETPRETLRQLCYR